VVGQVTEDLKKRLLGFVEFEKKRFQVFKWDVKPLYVEKPIENEFVKGVVDIVFSKNNKPYAIVDWKSGYNVSVSEDIRLQLSVYKVILDVEKAYVVFLSNPYNGVIEISALSKEEVQKIVESVWSGIRSGKFERKENRYCYACPYNTICKISTLSPIVRERLLKI
jgi:CRISPR/Cas system-associated exonuclease Cas4 (RecB family)